MGVDEGIKFTNALLELSDADFDSYIAQWKEKQSASEDISKILYRDEAEEAINAASDKMSDFNAKFEENGEENAKSWGEGFIEKMKKIMPDITDRINAAFSLSLIHICIRLGRRIRKQGCRYLFAPQGIIKNLYGRQTDNLPSSIYEELII